MGQAQPTDLAFLPGGRALVTTKTGNIWLFADNAMHSLGSIPNVHPSGERGLRRSRSVGPLRHRWALLPLRSADALQNWSP